jgi:hypothetical protein
MNQMKTITTRELADYVAMIGLADVRLDARAGAVPTILRLFAQTMHVPQGLSEWDRALLYAIYNTRQSSVLQVSDMETTVAKRIARPGIPGHTSSRSAESAIPLWANEVLPQRDANAIYWYHIAADQNNAAAEYDLAVRYVLGQGVPQSYAKASQWFRKAAEQGNAHAQFDLGVMYANGHGVRRDSVSAYKWWIVAEADSSLTDDAYDWSANRMKESASGMTADQIARAKQEASEWLAAHRSAR